jgi:cytochrome c
MKMKSKLLLIVCGGILSGAVHGADLEYPPESAFKRVVLAENPTKDPNGIVDPMELSVAKDGRVFFAERRGFVKYLDPKSGEVKTVGKVDVFTGLEDGLLGMTLDPNFEDNGWIYLFHSPPDQEENHVSRFTIKDDQLDLSSQKTLIRIKTQRKECCHSGGSLNFDAAGNLYASVGDNTNPFASDGFSPSDEQEDRSPWDAQKSSANMNDLRGKILRVRPLADGTVEIPDGNLFPKDGSQGRPEIYVMGNRNPYRISVDPRTGYLYWGEVGPDAGSINPDRGPAGFDEINQARTAGFFGWPYFIANNKAYTRYDFANKKSLEKWDPAKPINASPNNTGGKELPPAQSAFIYYPHSLSARFPAVNAGGGRTAMAGPVYYHEDDLKSPHKLPAVFDHHLFIYEWSRNWIIAVKLDEDEKIANPRKDLHRFLPGMTFLRPMDMELGPDGCLYVIQWGTQWSDNSDTQILRIEYHGDSPTG